MAGKIYLLFEIPGTSLRMTEGEYGTATFLEASEKVLATALWDHSFLLCMFRIFLCLPRVGGDPGKGEGKDETQKPLLK